MRCSMVSPQPNIMVAVVRMPSECAVRCTSIHSWVPHFSRLMRWRTASSRISAPPPGIESSPASRSRAMVSRSDRPLTSAMFVISGAEKQWQLILNRCLMPRKQILVPFDLQIGMQAALHENAGAAQVDGLLDLVEDDFLGQDVAFGVAHGPVEGAEAAVFGAEVGVVDVAVDDVGDDALGMQLAAHGVGLHADADQVVGPKQIEGFCAGDHKEPDRLF